MLNSEIHSIVYGYGEFDSVRFKIYKKRRRLIYTHTSIKLRRSNTAIKWHFDAIWKRKNAHTFAFVGWAVSTYIVYVRRCCRRRKQQSTYNRLSNTQEERYTGRDKQRKRNTVGWVSERANVMKNLRNWRFCVQLLAQTKPYTIHNGIYNNMLTAEHTHADLAHMFEVRGEINVSTREIGFKGRFIHDSLTASQWIWMTWKSALHVFNIFQTSGLVMWLLLNASTNCKRKIKNSENSNFTRSFHWCGILLGEPTSWWTANKWQLITVSIHRNTHSHMHACNAQTHSTA